ncbi:MAG: phospholipid carrier-dependent glycosyltransferase [Bryobacterales bacterium]|nr:phospholipid carrier-dependent glycosyltransferase [Bryobacterales bacterium]
MPFLRRFLPFATVAFALVVLYLYHLTAVGVLGPDEPRYSAIGQTMAHTGDLITPRLWGSPWFEKPPALYWMTALATALGADRDLAGRLPVALLSLIFLGLYFVLLDRQFGRPQAAFATAMLATSAGWLAYSELCLTDIPVAVFFSAAVLIVLPLLKPDAEPARLDFRMALIGIFLGLGSLAKGLVPLALAVPFAWFLRAYWRSWWIAAVTCLAVALPWYIAVYLQNGRAFIDEFFIRHHFERLYSTSLQHVQPWYYYLPVLLGGMFPWTPLLLLFPRQPFRRDRRLQFLAAISLFGFILFSASLNKLPGYILPLLPSLFALFAASIEGRPLGQLNKWWLLVCALLIACIPLVAAVLPLSLVSGRFAVSALRIDKTGAFYSVAPVLALLLARRAWLMPLLVLCIVASGLYVKAVCFPVLEQQVSARSLWKSIEPYSSELCDGGTNRDWIYGLSFYRKAAVPFCGSDHFRFMIRSSGHALPTVVPLAPEPRR